MEINTEISIIQHYINNYGNDERLNHVLCHIVDAFKCLQDKVLEMEEEFEEMKMDRKSKPAKKGK